MRDVVGLLLVALDVPAPQLELADIVEQRFELRCGEHRQIGVLVEEIEELSFAAQQAGHRGLYSIAGRRDYRTAGTIALNRIRPLQGAGDDLAFCRQPEARYPLSGRRTKGRVMTTALQGTKTGTQTAVLGGGCFWCLEAVFDQLNGVQSVESGYAGGRAPDPSYEEVCEGTSGHAEVVKIEFDPAILSFRDLLRVFFSIHDPTTLNRQGSDVGTQYRSVIYCQTLEQRADANAVIDELSRQKLWSQPIVTEIADAAPVDPTAPNSKGMAKVDALMIDIRTPTASPIRPAGAMLCSSDITIGCAQPSASPSAKDNAISGPTSLTKGNRA